MTTSIESIGFEPDGSVSYVSFREGATHDDVRAVLNMVSEYSGIVSGEIRAETDLSLYPKTTNDTLHALVEWLDKERGFQIIEQPDGWMWRNRFTAVERRPFQTYGGALQSIFGYKNE